MNSTLLIELGFLVLFIVFATFGTHSLAASHQRAAMPLHTLIVLTFGVLALASIVGGVIAIVRSAKSNTEFSLLGAKLSTGDVGVALVGIGLIIAYFTVRAVLKSARDLAALPSDKPPKPKKRKNRPSNQAIPLLKAQGSELAEGQRTPKRSRAPLSQ